MALPNLCAGTSANLPEELVEILAASNSVRIERIVYTGHSSPRDFWQDQDEHEWVVPLKGAAKLLFDGEEQPWLVQPGDFINIPAHRKHRVEWTSPEYIASVESGVVI